MTDPAPAIRALIDDLRDAAERFGDLEAMLQAKGYEANYARSCRQRLKQRIEKALVGLPVPEPTQEWQSIDNPPPTAQTVLLSNGYNVSSGYFAATDRQPRWHDASLTDYGLPATVWMPTPDPPEPAQEKERV